MKIILPLKGTLLIFNPLTFLLNGKFAQIFLLSEGQEICRDPRNVVRPLVAFLPAWFRFAQCIRRYHDTKKSFPHLVNAGKYSTSMFVTLISTIYSVYPGRKLFDCVFNVFLFDVSKLIFRREKVKILFSCSSLGDLYRGKY